MTREKSGVEGHESLDERTTTSLRLLEKRYIIQVYMICISINQTRCVLCVLLSAYRHGVGIQLLNMYVLGFRSVSTGEISKRSSKDTQKVTGMVKGEVPGKYSDRPSCPKVWTSMGMHLANSRFSGLQLPLLVIDPFKDSKMPETGKLQKAVACQ